MNAQVKEHFIKTYGVEKTVDILFNVLDSIPVSVFIKNEKLEKIFANKASLDLDESTVEDTIGYTDFDIHTPDNAAIFAAEDRAVLLEGKVRKNEEAKIRKDGTRVDFLTHKNRIELEDGRMLIVGSNTIIDDLKQREAELAQAIAALEANRSNLHEIFDAMPLGVTLINKDMKLAAVNKADREFWKLPADKDFSGMPFEQLCWENHKDFPEISRDAWASHVEKSVAEVRVGTIAPREEIGAGGRTLMYSAVTLSNGDRLTSCYDITEQKNALSALANANIKAERDFADMKATMDAMNMGIVLLDENLDVLFVNKSGFRMWNWHPEDCTPGEPFRKLIEINRHNGVYFIEDDEWEDFVASRLADLAAGDIEPYEFVRKDGTTLILSCKMLSGGKRLVCYYDITEQKNALSALAEANIKAERDFADMKATMDAMHMGIALLDENLNVLFVNKANYRLWNWHQHDFAPGEPFRKLIDINRHNGIYDVEDGDWEKYVAGRLSEIAAGDIEPREFLRKDGKALIYSCKSLSGGKRLVCYFDISQQKDAERTLVEAERKAILADRAKSEFLANMSHEIRTPMNGVLGMAELLARTNLDPKQKTFTDIIVKSGNALLTIINDILDFSKIDAGQLTLDPAPFRLAEAIEDVATLVSARAQEKDIELIVRVAPDLPEYVVGDVGRIRQIVTNLMGNAVKFTESGHVLVDVTGQTDVGAGLASLMFRITDTGIGIPEEKLRQVFEKFSQVDTSSTRRHEGTGLGLAISTKLVALMGGEIGAESEYGKGSTFWFKIVAPIHGAAVRKKVLPFDIDGARILIIDDNPVNRSILLEQMRSWHFDACAATGGREGLAVLGQAKLLGLDIDAIILDYHMPEMNGADVARIIRNTARHMNIPIILLTSVDTAMQGSEFDNVHINAHLMKPARSSLLFDTIVNVVREARSSFIEIHSKDLPKSLNELGQRMATFEVSRPTAEYSKPVPLFEQTKTLITALPTADVSAPKADIPAPARVLDILVAEDNAVNQIVFTQILENLNFAFEIVDNGRKAFVTMKAKAPSIILMDVSMPEMSGLEATMAIREYERANGLARTPIIGVTAHALKGDRERCLESGMDDYLSKPISPDMLEAKISVHMASQRPQKSA